MSDFAAGLLGAFIGAISAAILELHLLSTFILAFGFSWVAISVAEMTRE